MRGYDTSSLILWYYFYTFETNYEAMIYELQAENHLFQILYGRPESKVLSTNKTLRMRAILTRFCSIAKRDD